MELERRYTDTPAAAPALLRPKAAGGRNRICGYAAVFNVTSLPLADGRRERIACGAFSKLLATKPDVIGLFNHDYNQIIGRSGINLRLREDSIGLRYSIDAPNTGLGRDVEELLRLGILRSSSFSFYRNRDKERIVNSGREMVIEVVEFDSLTDVSVVTSPAYPAAKAWAEGKPLPERSRETIGVERVIVPARPGMVLLPDTELRRRRLRLFELQSKARC